MKIGQKVGPQVDQDSGGSPHLMESAELLKLKVIKRLKSPMGSEEIAFFMELLGDQSDFLLVVQHRY